MLTKFTIAYCHSKSCKKTVYSAKSLRQAICVKVSRNVSLFRSKVTKLCLMPGGERLEFTTRDNRGTHCAEHLGILMWNIGERKSILRITSPSLHENEVHEILIFDKLEIFFILQYILKRSMPDIKTDMLVLIFLATLNFCSSSPAIMNMKSISVKHHSIGN